jgi:hypothetical protein
MAGAALGDLGRNDEMGEVFLLILILVLFGPVVVAAVRSRMNRRSSPSATPRSAAEAAFYREAQHGRVFDCGRCGRPLSADWGSCQHCGATFDQFQPVRTDRLF